MAKKVTRFVKDWPSTSLRHRSKSENLTQCLWGDTVEVQDSRELDIKGEDDWVKVYTRRQKGRLQKKSLMEERPLEVNFVDVGQGDGVFIVTPDEKNILVDAGAKSNMYRFLKWRFNFKDKGRARAGDFEAAIITHPDKDHYYGFGKLFKDKRFKFKTVFHNGIVEREKEKEAPEIEKLGPTKVHDGQLYLTEVVRDMAELKALLDQKDKVGGKQYPKLLLAALKKAQKARRLNRESDIRMLSADQKAFEEKNNRFGKTLTMTALAPVTEKIGGRTVLRCFGQEPGETSSGDVGKTKNGHSVVTVLQYGRVRILLGGDLNIPAETYLMKHYGASGKKLFSVDVAKACHHGSADFSTEFLEWVNPLATVICSGDDEQYSHPRADSLGTVGKYSRGDRSLIFSTELARSAPEKIINPRAVRKRVLKLADKMVDVYRQADKNTPKVELEKALESARDKLVDKLGREIHRSVKVYGMISLRTDGEKVLMAQRLEKAASKTRKWDLYTLERKNGVLTYKSKHT